MHGKDKSILLKNLILGNSRGVDVLRCGSVQVVGNLNTFILPHLFTQTLFICADGLDAAVRIVRQFSHFYAAQMGLSA